MELEGERETDRQRQKGKGRKKRERERERERDMPPTSVPPSSLNIISDFTGLGEVYFSHTQLPNSQQLSNKLEAPPHTP